MTIKKAILFSVFSMLIGNASTAQTINLSTVDIENNPIMGMNIYLNDQYIGSNYEIKFSFEWNKGEVIYIRSDFYKEAHITINPDLFIDNNLSIEIKLEPKNKH